MVGNNILIRYLKAEWKSIILYSVIAFVSGNVALGYTRDIQWSYYAYFFWISIYIMSSLLGYNNYIMFGVSILVTFLLTILFIFMKEPLKRGFRNTGNLITFNKMIVYLKENMNGTTFFFWTLVLITIITIVGVIVSRKTYRKITKKDAPIGDRGEMGIMGELGNKAIYSNSESHIIYTQLVQYSDDLIKEYKNSREPPISYEINSNQLKNIDFKNRLKRICNSNEFKNELHRYQQEFLNKEDCFKHRLIIQHFLKILKVDVKKWIEKMLQYNKGLKYLSDELLMERDWDILYIKRDRDNKLEQTPFKELEKISEKWNWGGCLSNK